MDLNDWSYNISKDSISKEIIFEDFFTSFSFMSSIARVSEEF